MSETTINEVQSGRDNTIATALGHHSGQRPGSLLGTRDVPEMLELTAATEPGPFLPQTIQMGSYFGIRASDGQLVAMAGERLQSTAFTEISAVCTHPEFRGRGYARVLVKFLATRILAAGKTPVLHVKSENGALVVYQKIGFRLRAPIYLAVISLR